MAIVGSAPVVLVCTGTIAERRKLLRHFSRQGVRVVLYATAESALAALADDVACLVVCAFDNAWTTVDWLSALADHPSTAPVVFVHRRARSSRPPHRGSDERLRAPTGSQPIIHLSEAEFVKLAPERLLRLEAEVDELCRST